MNLVRAEFPYSSRQMMHWVTFDTTSGIMIDCPINPSHPERAEYQSCHFELRDGKVLITPPSGCPTERRYHKLVNIELN